MTKDKNNMDDFLRGSLESFEVKPSRNIWGKISKRLLILELVRFNFTNVGKYWLYSGMAALTAVAGLTFYNLNNEKAASSSNRVENELIVDQSDNTNNIIPDNTSKALLNSNELDKDELEQNTLLETEIEEEKHIAEVQNTVDAIPNQNQKYQSVQFQDEHNVVENTDDVATNAVEQNKDSTEKTTEEDQSKPTKEIESIIPINPSSNSEESIKESAVVVTAETKISETNAKEKQIEETKTVTKDQTKKTQKATYKKSKENTESEASSEKITYSFSANYMHNWPLDDKSYIPESNLFLAKVGMNWKRWEFKLGIGLQTEKSTARYQLDYESYDSVGYFFDISYYETIPGNPDSIIIHYIERALYDTVAHSQMEEMKLNSRWVVVPIEIGYELLRKDSYILAIGLSAYFGWEYYRDQMSFPAITSLSGVKYQNLGAETTSSFITLGLGIDNQFKIYKGWWFVVEPQIFYYLKTPYKWENSSASGPVGFGVNVGIKYKF